MQNNIFRKESMDRLRSPEDLKEYIRVARPGVWIVLFAIVLLLLGVIVWGIFGSAKTILQVGAYVEDGIAICYVHEEDAGAIEIGMPVSIDGVAGTVSEIAPEPIFIQGRSDIHPYLLQVIGLKVGDSCREVYVDIKDLEDGGYLAEITIESIRPVTFVIR